MAKNSTAPAGPQTEIVNKLSVKELIGKIKRPTEEDPGPHGVCSIYGMVRGLRRGESDKGPWLGFVGDFEGVAFESGDVKRGAQLFLPKAAEGLLLAAFEGAQIVNKETGEIRSSSVAFAFEISLKYSDNQFGYEYIVKPIVKATEGDPLAELRGDVQPQLPAPTRKLLALDAPAPKK